MLRAFLKLLGLSLLAAACAPAMFQPTLTAAPTVGHAAPTDTPSATDTVAPSETPTQTPTAKPLVPNFAHIVTLIFENREYGSVIGNSGAPTFNKYAQEYTLLTQEYAVGHPSLPNYLALIGGDTFGITTDCTDCFVNASTLPDEIETSGRSWKTYQQDMPKPCFLGDTLKYNQKHNPFIYFDLIRLDQARCERSIVPLTELDKDLAAGSVANYIFVTPNLCDSAHDCPLSAADAFLKGMMDEFLPALNQSGQPYLIIITFDEGTGEHGCCGLQNPGGRVATVLVSPQVLPGFEDDTPYTHYSILKTIEQAWGLGFIGHSADESNVLILAPWK